MQPPLYSTPLQLNKAFDNQPLNITNLGKSISQHIELIIFTGFGEHRHNNKFGFAIWDTDFELVVNSYSWEEKFKSSLLQSILEFEHRLYQLKLEIKIRDIEKKFASTDAIEAKKRVDISVYGKIEQTGEDYIFKTGLFLNPLSL
jgi:phage baseplate assembly protein W